MTAEDLISRLECDYIERLKWLIFREFRVLPYLPEAKKMSDEDVIMCGAHMVLDKRLRSEANEFEGGANYSFDEERFILLSEVK